MSPEYIFYLYIVALLLSILLGALKFAQFDPPSKVILVLLLVTISCEAISRITYHYHLGKNIVYHVDVVVEAFLMTLYFIMLIKPSKFHFYVLASACAWVLLGVTNALFFQPIKTLDTNVILVENFIIICMALYYFYKVLLNDEIITVAANYHFWYWVLFLFLSCGTFFFWAYLVLSDRKGQYLDVAQYVQAIINLITYSGIGVIFFVYPKKNVNGNR